MSADTRFSSAIHFLILVSESEDPLSSAAIAKSIGTNPSYVRKLAASLKSAGLIESRQGITGFRLSRPASKITFLEIAKAAREEEHIHLFEIHKNPNDECTVGHHIQPVLSLLFSHLDQSSEQLLSSITLQDCIDAMRKEIEADGRQRPS